VSMSCVPMKRLLKKPKHNPLSGHHVNGRDRVQDSGFRVQDSMGGGQWAVGSAKPQAVLPGIHPSSFPLPPSAFRLPPLRGFTLIEILLTLCLLVIMSSMAWPQLEKAFSNQRLRKAADMVRTQWCKARIEAMSAGCIRIFRFEIEGNKYRVDGLADNSTSQQTGATADPLATDAVQVFLADKTSSSQNNGNLGGTSVYPEKTLPKDVFFVSSQTVVDTRAATAVNSMSSAGNMPAGNLSANNMSSADDASSTGGSWSEPIFFYPDGTTSTAQLVLKNKEGRMIELFLRGLTGVVKVSDITSSSGQGNL